MQKIAHSYFTTHKGSTVQPQGPSATPQKEKARKESFVLCLQAAFLRVGCGFAHQKSTKQAERAE